MTQPPMAQPGMAQDPTANCIFCKIVKGEIPSRKIYEDDRIIAVLDVFPASPGHIIIIPKQHFMILPQLPPDLAAHCAVTAKKLSGQVLQGLGAQGVNIFVANGAVAGQKAPHFLMHVIPRYEGDGINFTLPESQLQDAELEKIHNEIMPALQKAGFGPGGKGPVAPAAAPSAPAGGQAVAAAPMQPSAPMQSPTVPSVAQLAQQVATPAQEPAIPGTRSEQNIFDTLKENPRLKELLIEHPETVMKLVQQNPTIGELFVGHSITELSEKLKSMAQAEGTSQPTAQPAQPAPQTVQQPMQQTAQPEAQQQQQPAPAPVQPQQPVAQPTVSQQPVAAPAQQQAAQPQVSPVPAQQPAAPAVPQQGAPHVQQNVTEEQLMQVINAEQSLRQAIIENPQAVIGAVAQNDQLKFVFQGHDIMALSAKLKSEPAQQATNLDKISAMFDAPMDQPVAQPTMPQPNEPLPAPTAQPAAQPMSQSPAPVVPQQPVAAPAQPVPVQPAQPTSQPTQSTDEDETKAKLDKISKLFD